MKPLGQWGEEVAAGHLAATGVEVLERNWRTTEGEIDLIGIKDGSFVFVEVKTRKSTSFGPPEGAVDARKQRRIQRSAWRYLESINELQADWRIDVIAIEQSSDGQIGRIDHYVNAVEASEDLQR
ncbi:MAG: YraN family protein [Anaerolineales bacterium]